jgi:hypothetical protein
MALVTFAMEVTERTRRLICLTVAIVLVAQSLVGAGAAGCAPTVFRSAGQV